MYIVSYDIAHKSLALCILYFNNQWLIDINKIHKKLKDDIKLCDNAEKKCKCILDCLNALTTLLNELIKPILFDVVDLLPNKKLKDSNPIERSSRIKSYLHSVDNFIETLHIDNLKLLLEFQMAPNDKSRNIFSQILFHYSYPDSYFNNTNNDIKKVNICFKKYDIEIIGPSLKNKLNLIPNKPYSYFIKKYTKLYNANKNHSKSNFLYWIKCNNITHMIKKIKKKNLDDIADATNMSIAWICKQL